jgi:sugar lactone lactonase YvrE
LTDTIGERGSQPGEFNFPTTIALGVGSLWVGDTLNFRIQRLDAVHGEPLREFGQLGDAPGEMPRIKGITIDASGFLWISDAHLNQVSLYDPDGTFLMYLGETSETDDGFSFPAGIASHPDGRIAVVDSLNRRIQVYRLVFSPKSEKG